MKLETFSRQHRPQPTGPRHQQKQRQHQHQGCVQLAKRPQRWFGCRMLRKLSSTRQSTPQVKWVFCPTATSTRGSWEQQASAPTCFNPSVPSHSNWQGLKPSIQLTSLIVDYGPEILGGEDANGLSQGAGGKLSVYSAIPRHSTDIQRELYF